MRHISGEDVSLMPRAMEVPLVWSEGGINDFEPHLQGAALLDILRNDEKRQASDADRHDLSLSA